MAIRFIVCGIVALIFGAIGVSCWRAKEAVGFFSFVKPPAISAENVGKYNHAIAVLWFLGTVLLEIICIPVLFAKQNSPVFAFIPLEAMLWSIAMMVVYVRIEARYRA